MSIWSRTEELRKEVLDYIGSHGSCVIATCSKDLPQAATLIYANDGFNVIVHTTRDTEKVRNIQANPKVALVIDDQGREGLTKAKSIQYIGKADIISSGGEQEKAVGIYVKKYSFAERALTPKALSADQRIIKISPEKIYFTDYTKGFGHREELTTF